MKRVFILVFALSLIALFLVYERNIAEDSGVQLNGKEFQFSHGRYWAPISFNRNVSDRALVDTGSAYSSIKEKILKNVEHRELPPTEVSSVVGHYSLDVVKIKEINFSGKRKEDSVFLVSSVNVIGANLLFDNPPVTLGAEGVEWGDRLGEGTCVPFKMDYFGSGAESGISALYIGLEINGKLEYALLDTGGRDYLTGIENNATLASRVTLIMNSDGRISLATYSNESADLTIGSEPKSVRYRSYKSGFNSRAKFVIGAKFLEEFSIHVRSNAGPVCLIKNP